MKRSIAVSVSTLALLSSFSGASHASDLNLSDVSPDTLIETGKRLKEWQKQDALIQKGSVAALARAMVDRPVDQWNGNLKTAFCNVRNSASLLSLVDKNIQRERKRLGQFIAHAATGGLKPSAIEQRVGSAYSDIIHSLNEGNISRNEANDKVDSAADIKKADVRGGIAKMKCE